MTRLFFKLSILWIGSIGCSVWAQNSGEFASKDDAKSVPGYTRAGWELNPALSDVFAPTIDTVKKPNQQMTVPASLHRPLTDAFQQFDQDAREAAGRIQSEWLIRLKTHSQSKKAASKRIADIAANLGGQLIRTGKLRHGSLLGVMRFPESLTFDQQKAKVTRAKFKDVQTIQPNYRYEMFGKKSHDPLLKRQWGLSNNGTYFDPRESDPVPGADSRAREAWAFTRGSKDIIVAVSDTGIAYQHPDLAPNMWHNPGEIPANGIDDDNNGYVDDIHGYDFGDFDADPFDQVDHGTHVAGLIGAAGDNGIGGSGVAPNISLMALKITGRFGFADTFSIVEAFQYAADHGARIINASWGGFFPDEILLESMRTLGDAGVLFVTAAGNDGFHIDSDFFTSAVYPAAFDLDNQITVAATDAADQLASFSNFGERRVHLAAPGVSNLSTVPGREILLAEDFEDLRPPLLPPGFGRGGAVRGWQTVTSGDFSEPGNQAMRTGSTRDPFSGASHGNLFLPRWGHDGQSHFRISFDFNLRVAGPFKLRIQGEQDGDWFNIASLNAEAFHPRSYFRTTLFIRGENLAANGRIRFYWESEPAEDGSLSVFEMDNLVIYRDHNATGHPSAAAEAYEVFSGTSMAAPHVAGAAALLLSEQPDMSVNELRMRLIHGSRSVPNLQGFILGGKVLDAASALRVNGGLQLYTDIANKEIKASAFVPIRWSHFDDPNAPLEVSLLRGDEVVLAIANSSTSGGYVPWLVPELPSGDDYALRLSSGNQILQSERFTITPSEPIQFEDPLLQSWLTDPFDRNRDGVLTQSEANDYKGILSIPPLPITDLRGLDEFKFVHQLLISPLPAVWNIDLKTFERLDRLLISGVDIGSFGSFPESLKGLAFFGLNVKEIPALPQNLENLILVNTPVETLETLPDSLTQLTLWRTSLTELSNLPPNLNQLQLTFGQFRRLPFDLPKNLRTLDLSGNPWENFPSLEGVKASVLWLSELDLETLPEELDLSSTALLGVYNNRLTSLPEIPDLLGALVISNNRLTTLPDLPASLARLEVDRNLLTQLPEIPRYTRLISVSENQLTSLPQLDHIDAFSVWLDAFDNQLTDLPALPPRIFSVRVAENQLTELPQLPQSLFALDVTNNELATVPELPVSLRELVAVNNRLAELPNLPSSLAILNVTGNRLTEIQDLSGLQRLAFVWLGDNLLTEVPNLPDHRFFSGIHLERNLLGDDDVSALIALRDRELPGSYFPTLEEFLSGGFLTGEPLDGLVFNPLKDGSILNIDALPLADGLAAQTGTLPSGAIQITWHGGTSQLEQALSHYAIWQLTDNGETRLGQTTNTWFNLPIGSPNETTRYRIEAVLENDAVTGDMVDIDVTPNQVNPSHRYIVHGIADKDLHYALCQIRARQTTELHWTLFNAHGVQVANTESLSIQAGQRLTRTLPGMLMTEGGWGLLESDAPLDVIGLTGSGNRRITALNTKAINRRHGMVPMRPSDFALRSTVSLINPNDDATANVRFTFIDANGQMIAQTETAIDSRHMWTGDPLEQLEVNQRPATTYVVWESDTDLHAEVLSGSGVFFSDVLTGLGGESRPALSGILPAFGLIYYYNPEPVTAYLTMAVHAENGTILDERTIALPGHRMQLISPSNMFMRAGSAVRVNDRTLFRFKSSSPVSVWTQFGGQSLPRASIAEDLSEETLPAITTFGDRFIVPHVTSANAPWGTQIRLLNDDDVLRPIVVHATDGNGNTIGTVNVQLAAAGQSRFEARELLADAGLSEDALQQVVALEIIADAGTRFAVNVVYYSDPAIAKLMAGINIAPIPSQP